MYEVTEETELKEILNTLKPLESKWCKKMYCEVVMFETGHSMNFYNEDNWVGGYFVPKKD